MKKIKKALTIVVAVMATVMFISMIPGVAQKVSADTGWTAIGSSDCRYKIETSGSEVIMTIGPANDVSGTLPDGSGKTDWPWNSNPEKDNITKVVFQSGVKAGKNVCSLFYELGNVKSIDFADFDTSNVESMGAMFCKCSNLETLDLSNFDTKNVKDITDMFNKCGNLKTIDLSSFDTKNVTQAGYMFYECSNLTTIYASDKFDVSKLDGAFSEYMFASCTNLVGGAGTKFNGSKIRNEYARIDGGSSAPGYFTKKTEPVPSTGDSNNSMVYFVLLSIMIALMAVTVFPVVKAKKGLK